MTGMMLGAARRQNRHRYGRLLSPPQLQPSPAVSPPRCAAISSPDIDRRNPANRVLLAHLDISPILDLDMRLGEGTGAVLAMPILEAAHAPLSRDGHLRFGRRQRSQMHEIALGSRDLRWILR